MPNPQVRTDIYPAKFTVTQNEEITTYDKVRVILTLDHAYVFQDNGPTPNLVFEDRLVSYTPPVPSTRVRKAHQLLDRSAKLTTEDGYEGTFIRIGGCGCGSKLKNMPLSELLPDTSLSQMASKNDSDNQ